MRARRAANGFDAFRRCFALLAVERKSDGVLRRVFGNTDPLNIHAVIMPRATVNKYGVECQVLQPSARPMIRDYEAAQDSVGEWFSCIGLVRGEPRKQAIRDALNNGKAPPTRRRHVRPAEWRAKEELRLAKKAATLEKRERSVRDREDIAEDVISFAQAVSSGAIDENGTVVDPSGAEGLPPDPNHKSGFGFVAARKAFRAVANRLRLRSDAKAKLEAEKQVAAEIAEIKKADAAILAIARLLPDGLKSKVAAARRKLSASIMVLDPSAKGRNKSAGSNLEDPE